MWQWASAQAIGGRPEQQDRIGGFASTDGQRLLLVVADGLGGHGHGAAAAELVVQTIQNAWEDENTRPLLNEHWLMAQLTAAAAQIVILGAQYGGAPRSTATVLLIDDHQGFWCHLGDTRLYHGNSQTLHLCTRDDSVARMLVDLGDLSELELPQHPDRNLLTRTLGENAEPQFRTGILNLEQGNSVLLCSDGLWEQVTLTEMMSALAMPELQAGANYLMELAIQRAGLNGDNVSVILARQAQSLGIRKSNGAAQCARLPSPLQRQ